MSGFQLAGRQAGELGVGVGKIGSLIELEKFLGHVARSTRGGREAFCYLYPLPVIWASRLVTLYVHV